VIETYRNEFGQLVELIQTMGVKDTGDVGQFRTAAHMLEASIQNSEDLVASQTTLLQLRRHEKDYLLRGDDAYIEHTRETAAQLRREIETALPEDESRSAMLELLDAYLTGLYKVVRISGDIDEHTSLFRDAAHKIELSSHKFAATGLAEGHRQIAEAEAICANAYATVTTFAVVALLLGLGFAYVLGRNLTLPIRLLSGTAVQVADGNLSP
jgi:methyl-accepting chemotaxis protein